MREDTGPRPPETAPRALDDALHAISRAAAQTGDAPRVAGHLATGARAACDAAAAVVCGPRGVLAADAGTPEAAEAARARAREEPDAFHWIPADVDGDEGPGVYRLGLLPHAHRELDATPARALAAHAALAFHHARTLIATRATQARYRRLFDTLTDAVIVARADGGVVFANAAARALGVRPDEPVQALFHADAATALRELVAAPPEDAGHPRLMRLRHADEAGPRVAEVRARHLALPDEARAALLVVHDVTERERAERRFQEQRRALVQAEKLAAVGSLTAGVAHEVNNPLAYIIGNEEMASSDLEVLVADDRLPQDARALLQETLEGLRSNIGGLHHIKRIVASLRDFSRASHRERAPVDLAAVARSALVLAGDHARQAGVRLEEDVTPLPPVNAAREEIGQALMNLIVNGVDAAGSGGRVRISGRADATCVEFRVTDSGPGVPEGIRGKIFNPFFTTKSDGVGLGLSLAQKIVKDHGGHLDFRCGASGGTTFRVRFPRVDAARSDGSS